MNFKLVGMAFVYKNTEHKKSATKSRTTENVKITSSYSFCNINLHSIWSATKDNKFVFQSSV